MAITVKNVWVAGQAKDLAPTGHGAAVAAVDIGTVDHKKSNREFQIACNGSANSNKVTAYDALLGSGGEVEGLVDTLVGTTMGVDTSGNTVKYSFKVTSLTRGLVDNDILLAEANDVYVVKGELTIGIS